MTEHYERWPLVLVSLPEVDPTLVHELIEDAWSERVPKPAVQTWLAQREEAATG